MLTQACPGEAQGPRECPDFTMTTEQAEAIVVTRRIRLRPKSRRVRRPVTLKWLAENDPGHLDTLLDRTPPDTSLFYALVLLTDKYKVAVARAVAGDPLILLADEPTGNLDSKNGESVMQLLSELHQGGATLIMVTHSDELAERSWRVVRLRDGRKESDEAVRN